MHRAMLSKCFLDIFFYFSSRFKTNQRENIPWNHHVSTPLRRFPLNFIYCVSSSPTSVCPQVQIESTPKQLCICSLIHWTNIYWEPSICKYLVHITMSKEHEQKPHTAKDRPRKRFSVQFFQLVKKYWLNQEFLSEKFTLK